MVANFGDLEQAVLAFIVNEYKKVSENPLGRTVVQKLCYHAKMRGIPIQYSFEIYHYGPFCQAIYNDMEELIMLDVIDDENPDPEASRYVPGTQMEQYLEKGEPAIRPYKEELSKLIKLFSQLGPKEMELLSTLHYSHKSYKDFYGKVLGHNEIIEKFKEIKGNKFSDKEIEWAYDALKKHNLLD